MTDDRTDRAFELFERAVACPPEQRAAFLERACPDDEALRGEVCSLLRHNESADGFLTPPSDPSQAVAAAVAAARPQIDLLIGHRVGHFRIERVLASGGMATVYEAVQDEPKRLVALKVMHRGFASTQALRRFQFESHVLGRLRHPHVAQVYEAGIHDFTSGDRGNPGDRSPTGLSHPGDRPSAVLQERARPEGRGSEASAESVGRVIDPTPGSVGRVIDPTPGSVGRVIDASLAVPYFAMELVPGARPITQFAAGEGLDVKRRLELFAKVCDAVHHGHQKGVIHRDLKPANILVDSAGEPKVIDFGVARATDADVALTTLQTDVGQIVGTVQYMSPEQCDGDPHDLDIRSDIYALGVVLYELLSGELPYEVSRTSIVSAARTIRERPPRPLLEAAARRTEPCSPALPARCSPAAPGRIPEPCSPAAPGRIPEPCSPAAPGRIPEPCSPAAPGRIPEPCSPEAPGRAVECSPAAPGRSPTVIDRAVRPLPATSEPRPSGRARPEGQGSQGTNPKPGVRRDPYLRALRGDVETIVHKALEKDRDRRYASAADLAQDIRRHLSGEPIEARPPSRWARAIRWLSRHPLIATTAASVLISLAIIGGTILTLLYLSGRPYRVLASQDGQELRLVSFTGRTLHRWTADGGRMSSAVFVRRPGDAYDEGVVVVGYRNHPRYGDQLCAFEVAQSLSEPVWTDAIAPDRFPPLVRDGIATRRRLGANLVATADVFRGIPGEELIVTFVNEHSQVAVCVYDLRGNLLYQFWHDGGVNSFVYLSGTNRLICAGDNGLGHLGRIASVVFAVTPELGLIDGEIMRRLPAEVAATDAEPLRAAGTAGERRVVPVWYYQLDPRETVPGRQWPKWTCTIVAYRDDPARYCTFSAVYLNGDQGGNLCWRMNAEGRLDPSSLFPDDRYKANQAEHPDPDDPLRLPDPSEISLVDPISEVTTLSREEAEAARKAAGDGP